MSTKMKLFCIPFAGGSASVYTSWKKAFLPDIELIPIELAGKGSRFNQPLYENIEQAVSDILSILQSKLDSSPYALFGHSMGALLVFEVLHALKEQNAPMPITTFFSGKNPPHIAPTTNRHKLEGKAFWEEVRSMGGTPAELMTSTELMDIFTPILKRDFKLVETYAPNLNRELITTPVTVLYGTKDDTVSVDRMTEWSRHTSEDISFATFDGGHFFIQEHEQAVISLVNQTLLSTMLKV
ncbi:alpha/beta fold hydrolase [Brevibacillus laterosporus]|uniref:thioesterase II family protein n=1 Tax=Brevibacillus TaxID=55080 RepID=UPI001AFF8FB6|nr:alpha/beta fold hydrolase [Brevibacillus halotolerans]GIO01166.1 thioesterase [Brevibacillus halotolerans]